MRSGQCAIIVIPQGRISNSGVLALKPQSGHYKRNCSHCPLRVAYCLFAPSSFIVNLHLMKKTLLLLCSLLVQVLAFAQTSPLPKIAIASFGIESSTFSPARTHEEAFHAKYDDQVYTNYPFFADTGSIRKRAQWFPTLAARSLPGGAVTREAYESIVSQILERLQKNVPYTGMFLDLHGAMSVVGLDDPEGDFITRIRKVIGPNTLLSTSMDLHGNVSERLARNADILTCYRMAPHEDAMETKQRAVENLLRRIESGKGKPKYKAWIPIPVLLPGEQTSTRIEPAKSIYAAVPPIANQEGIVDAAIWVGYPWADEPRNHAVVMVIGDDQNKVKTSAERLANLFWNSRKQFGFVAPTASLEECMKAALASKTKPYFVSDMGDNPTAGGAGDVTWTLQQLLARPEFKTEAGPSLIYASIPGPDLIEKAIKAGVGNMVTGVVGAQVDARFAPPIEITGEVMSIVEGDRDAETEVVVKTGSINVIVTRKRKPYHKENDFTRLGLKPRETNIVMVKIGYLEPELYAMQKGWMMALTKGGVDQALERLPYKRIKRPMYPLDKDMKDPDLSVRWIEPMKN
jgi:microcystin degradation protein MlrC